MPKYKTNTFYRLMRLKNGCPKVKKLTPPIKLIMFILIDKMKEFQIFIRCAINYAPAGFVEVVFSAGRRLTDSILYVLMFLEGKVLSFS